MRRAGAVVATMLVLFTMSAAVPLDQQGSSAWPGPEPATPIGPLGRPLPDPTPPQPVSYWENRYVHGWDQQHTTAYLPLSRSRDSWDHYSLAYGVDQNTAMYRATGRVRYLDRALLYVSNVVASARVSSSLAGSAYRDGYLGSATTRSGIGGEVPLYESYFWRYATTLLRVIRRTPALYDNPIYRQQYDRLLAFAEVHVFEKWHRRGPDDTIYRSRTHMTAHWAAIALNLALVTSDAVRRAAYRAVVDDFDMDLRGQMRDNPAVPQAYFWSDKWGSTDRPGQDVGHGNGVMSYVVEAHDFGTQWTPVDMDRFGVLLTAVIWPRDRVYRRYVDGTGTDNGWFADGFVKLGRYSVAVQRRLEHHAVVNHQFIANMALNARLLSGS
ncbi:MAG TPA: hypothetical protein VFR67_13590 [Pilimelia sp.]|nr:hypothetical protein [Pilimelia sp.]